MQHFTKSGITQLSYDIVGAAIMVHRELGPGLLESVYEKYLHHQLVKDGHHVVQQMKIPLIYDSLSLEIKLRLDLLVDDSVVVEIKAVQHILPVHQALLMTYMKLLQKPQGLLINFNTVNITKSVKPMVNDFFKILED